MIYLFLTMDVPIEPWRHRIGQARLSLSSNWHLFFAWQCYCRMSSRAKLKQHGTSQQPRACLLFFRWLRWVRSTVLALGPCIFCIDHRKAHRDNLFFFMKRTRQHGYQSAWYSCFSFSHVVHLAFFPWLSYGPFVFVSCVPLFVCYLFFIFQFPCCLSCFSFCFF